MRFYNLRCSLNDFNRNAKGSIHPTFLKFLVPMIRQISISRIKKLSFDKKIFSRLPIFFFIQNFSSATTIMILRKIHEIKSLDTIKKRGRWKNLIWFFSSNQSCLRTKSIQQNIFWDQLSSSDVGDFNCSQFPYK